MRNRGVFVAFESGGCPPLKWPSRFAGLLIFIDLIHPFAREQTY